MPAATILLATASARTTNFFFEVVHRVVIVGLSETVGWGEV